MPEGVSVEIKLINYWRDEPQHGSDHFGVQVQVLIGEVGDDYADSFDLFVCSPSFFAETYAADRWDEEDSLPNDLLLPGGNVLAVVGVWLMKAWSRSDLEASLSGLVAAYSPGPDFGTVAARIGRIVPWEFDYRWDDTTNESAGLPRLSSST